MVLGLLLFCLFYPYPSLSRAFDQLLAIYKWMQFIYLAMTSPEVQT